MKNTEVASPLLEVLEGRRVSVRYAPEHRGAIYDVCSLEGRILITGRFNGGDILEIDLSPHSGNSFNLFILDGMKVHKKLFRLNLVPEPKEA